MPAMTSAASAICGTHFGDTKLVTSISRRPACCSRCTSSILTAAGTICFSFCRPSRGPTSTSLTLRGNVLDKDMVFPSITLVGVHHTSNLLPALHRHDLADDLRDAVLTHGTG